MFIFIRQEGNKLGNVLCQSNKTWVNLEQANQVLARGAVVSSFRAVAQDNITDLNKHSLEP